jgi:hypothetical protein
MLSVGFLSGIFSPNLLLLLLLNRLPPDITGGQGQKKTFLKQFYKLRYENNV